MQSMTFLDNFLVQLMLFAIYAVIAGVITWILAAVEQIIPAFLVALIALAIITKICPAPSYALLYGCSFYFQIKDSEEGHGKLSILASSFFLAGIAFGIFYISGSLLGLLSFNEYYSECTERWC